MNKSILYLTFLLTFSLSNVGAQITELGRIDLGANGSNDVMGVKIGPDGKIWYVDNSQRKVFRIDNTHVNGDGNMHGYFNGTNTFVEIASGASDGITTPVDLDFHPTRPNELWILNQGTANTGGNSTIITNPGESNQNNVFREDGNAWHFMALATAMEFGDNGDWATSQGILDANRNGTNFTGPTLWPGDLSIYAMVGDPPTQTVNGSHLDMVHQSPYSMGIAHEIDNVYWVFDGFNNNIVRYDFQQPHYPGGFDHDDAIVRRYTDVQVEQKGTLPAHMVIDDNSQLLFICDTDNNRILQVDISTGSFARNLSPANNETLAEYSEYENVVWKEAITGLQDPIGIDISGNNYMIVSDNATSEIIVYQTTTLTGVEANKAAVKFSFALFPNPTNGVVRIETTGLEDETVSTLNVLDITGRKVVERQINLTTNNTIDLSELPSGIYHVSLFDQKNFFTQKLVLRK